MWCREEVVSRVYVQDELTFAVLSSGRENGKGWCFRNGVYRRGGEAPMMKLNLRLQTLSQSQATRASGEGGNSRKRGAGKALQVACDFETCFHLIQQHQQPNTAINPTQYRQNGWRSQLEEVMAPRAHVQPEARLGRGKQSTGRAQKDRPSLEGARRGAPVSYTHLTLPTIYSV